MRTLLTVLFVSVSGAALALPPVATPATVGSGVVEVQNRFLPGFLGGGDKNAAPDNTQLRLDQLETQVRSLTGQVEQLTFTIRRLESALQNQPAPAQRAPGQQGSLSGTGAPPAPLGSSAPAPAPAQNTQSAGAAAGGPIDLSALNRSAAEFSTTPAPAASTPEPAASAQPGALANARQLQQSGRFAMAADEARAVLAANPNGPVAGEARYLLGEALMAQGDFRTAANLFLENYTSDPNSEHAPSSLLKLGTALNGLGEKEAACSSLEELIGAYPNADAGLRAEAERERQAANCA
ncbi:tetratricopeptide repeat protein [Acuticoccus sp. MNP-M23]|uniref:tetratricopeptide repeat protein n=1 Tax=Acuticoccus sp. MNP-M23 TaxID=3072793 RepID=UPI0028154222|nr:tetratricopeptide repeat protein [Acuticoccus sp. MNP-M23]WMS43858.1 tetratricopeptide repeat protein [Acuticoccus sp. MNP-M23]